MALHTAILPITCLNDGILIRAQEKSMKNDEFSDIPNLNFKQSNTSNIEETPDIDALKIKAPVLQKNSEDHFCCPACDKTFASRSATFRHYRNHSGNHPYVCSMCQKSFTSKASLDNHQLRIHDLHKEIALSCSECGKLFIRRNALEVHLKTHSLDKPFICEHCGKSFTQKVTRDIHVTKHTGKLNFHCSVCKKSFASQAKLNSHGFVHRNPRFTCELCGRGFVRRDSLAVHARTHSGERLLHCTVCSQSFTSHSRLLMHNQMHCEEQCHQCPNCSAQFKQKSELEGHVDKEHNMESVSYIGGTPTKEATQTSEDLFGHPLSSKHLSLPIITGQTGFTVNSGLESLQKECFLCPHCGKDFQNKQSLNIHEQAHRSLQRIKDQSHTCHLCPKRFAQKSKLTAHIMTHVQEPSYQCNTCGKRFHRKDVYRHHVFLHTNERPFSCAHCGKAFASKFNLGVHLKTHSIATPNLPDLQCNDCGKKFKHKKTYALHRRTHSGDFPHTCVTCGKKFMQKSHFEGHLRSHMSDRPFQCTTCGRRFKERKHCREHARKAHPSTFSLASLFASITNEDAQMEQITDILCPSDNQLHQDSSGLNVSRLSDQLQPIVEIPDSAATASLDSNFLLTSHVNLSETSPASMPNLVFANLEPMLNDIEIPDASQYLIASDQGLNKSDSCSAEVPENTISLTILPEGNANVVLSQGLES